MKLYRPVLQNFITATVVAVGVLGCGSSDTAPKPASQIAAKVNKGEISVHQINTAMSRLSGIPEPQVKQASQQILERLIDQEVLVQKAIESKVDREPRVMQAVESSRRQILSQAYIEQVMAAAPQPSADEINKFFAEHPELFKQRRVYQLQEVSIIPRSDQIEKVSAEIKKTKSMNDLVNWLKAEDVRFSANTTVKGAEQLPLEVLPKIYAAQEGQVVLLPAPNGVAAVQVLSSRAMPLNEKNAIPYIEQYLKNQQRVKIAQQEIKQLRDAAKVNYVGEFAKLAAAKTNVMEAQDHRTRSESASEGSDYMGKGISGLE